MFFPDSLVKFSLFFETERTCFLKNFITRPNIIVGDYTYYDDETDVRIFEKNVLYHFEFLNDKLFIGKFCQIASGVKFLMNWMFHATHGLSTFPFAIFSQDCQKAYPKDFRYPFKGGIRLLVMMFGLVIMWRLCWESISEMGLSSERML